MSRSTQLVALQWPDRSGADHVAVAGTGSVHVRIPAPVWQDVQAASTYIRVTDGDLLTAALLVVCNRMTGQEAMRADWSEGATADAQVPFLQLDVSGDLTFAALSQAVMQQRESGQTASASAQNLIATFTWTDGEASMELRYHPLVGDEIAGQVAEHLLILLAVACKQLETCIHALPVLSETEFLGILERVNSATRVEVTVGCLHQLVEQQAARTPEGVAFVYGQTRLTYREVNERANRLARRLRQMQVGPDRLVGVCMERRPELVIALLAVLKAGGAYVPLDPDYPLDRIGYMLEQSQATVVLTQDHLRSLLPETAADVLCVDWSRDAYEDESGENVGVDVTPQHLAYVIYTSGSTGQPKGVAIEHYSAAVLVHWSQQLYSAEELAGVLFSTSVCFDISVWEIFTTLSTGGKLIFAQNALELPDLPAAEDVTLINTVPSAMAELVRMGGVPQSVRTVNVAGEPLKPWLVEGVYALPQIEKMYNLYGPTEDTVYSTGALMSRTGETVPPIGIPVSNTRAYILNSHLQPVSLGVPGELYLAGEGLARGYLHRPDLTAERFIPDPFDPEARMYRTGDLVRALPDGTIVCLGRIDHQVKIRGFRIELGEIESRLMKHPLVTGNVVVAHEEEGGSSYLAAYVTLLEGHVVDQQELRRHLEETLTDYMVPSFFVILDEIPLTPNGKVDRKALPVPTRTRIRSQDSYVAPRDALEQELTAEWADVLRMPADEIGIHDPFHEFGGHSLHVTQVLARVRKRHRVAMTMADLFNAPTVAALAEQIRARAEAASTQEAAAGASLDAAATGIQALTHGEHLPLSYAQQRLWFWEQLEPGNQCYIVPTRLHLAGDLDVALLQQSLQEVLRRHPVMRSRFLEADGAPIQVIDPVFTIPLEELDVRGLPEAERQARFVAKQRELARTPFDLSVGRLIRACLVQMQDHEYELVLAMHHIITDDWSLQVMRHEIAAHYEAFRTGHATSLPALEIQYADYAVYQREWLEREGFAHQLAYWQQKLHGAPTVLTLPTDRPRPARQTFIGEDATFTLSAELTAALRRLCQQEGLTLFMVLLAAYNVLLHRHSGQDDLLVGVPVANRTQEEIESLLGFFVNTVVMRSELGEAMDIRAYLQQIRQTSLEAFVNQDVPFEKMVEVMQPDRDPSVSPLIQAMFNLQNVSVFPPQSSAVQFGRLHELHNGAAKLDLSLFVQDEESHLGARWIYNTDLYEESTIATFHDQLVRILTALVADLDAPLAKISLLGAAEQQQLLVEWNQTERSFGDVVCVQELFAQQAARQPDALAVVCEEQTLTYGALDRQANQLAHALMEKGVGPDTLVGLYIDRSVEMITGLLGILKAGGAYVALDPALPPERVALMIAEAQLQHVVTVASLQAELPASSAEALVLEAIVQSGAADRQPTAAVQPEHLAYVIFTSGSTGKPKGVLVEHRNLYHYLQGVSEALELEPGMSYATVSTLAADLGNTMIFPALCTGGTLHVMTKERATDPQLLADYMSEHAVDCMKIVPSHLSALLSVGNADVLPRKRLVFGGETLHGELVDQVQALAPNCRVINHYGPTETTVGVVTNTLPDRLPDQQAAAQLDQLSAASTCVARSIPLGRPLANTTLYVLDALQQPVPVGVPGELYIGGLGVTRGYLHNEELTAEKFVANPFGPGRLYRSGDRVRYLKDGRLEFLGRIDNQVKIRGYRIELGEIEAALRECPGVRDAVVLASTSDRNQPQLVAYVVSIATAQDLKQTLASRLPSYLVPASIMVLEQIPLTANGKVDRRALPAPLFQDGATADKILPRTAVEQTLADLWSDLLGLHEVGIHDHFFESGGHSLLATQLISRVRQAFRVQVPLRAVFEAPVLAQFAELLAASQATAAPVAEEVEFRIVERGTEFLTSFEQQRMWFLEQMDPGSAIYNVPLMMRMQGELNVAALHQSLHDLVQRHEILRTTFVYKNGQPLQVVHPERTVELPQYEVSEADLHARALASVQRGFDLAAGPLLRVELLRLQPTEHVLVLVMHHIVSDAWSKGLMAHDLAALYAAHLQGVTPELPTLTYQYADYADWQRRWFQGDVLEQQLSYWKKQLGGTLPVLHLPTDFPRPAVQTYRGAFKEFPVPAQTAHALKQLAHAHNVTPFMLLITAYKLLLHRYTGQDDLLVGTPVAGRNRMELEQIVGYFINSLVIRTDLSGDPSVVELIERVRDLSLDAFNHQDLPFDKLVEELAPERDSSRAAVFQTWFVLINTPPVAWELPGLAVTATEIDWGVTKFDLSLEIAEGTNGANGMVGTFNYNVDLFQPATVDQIIDQFLFLLDLIVAEPDLPLSAVVGRMTAQSRLLQQQKEDEYKENRRSRFKRAKQ